MKLNGVVRINFVLQNKREKGREALMHSINLAEIP